MKVFVTGATGFLGTHILEQLKGHDVVALSRQPRTDVDFVVGDVLDPSSLAAAIDGCDAVIHAAGLVDHGDAMAEQLWRIHVRGTENLLDAAKSASVRRVVIVSTSGTVAVSADANAVATEDSPTPLGIINDWPYYRSKLFAEQLALTAASDELEVVSLNPSLLLGPGDVDGSSSAAVRLFLDGQVPVCPRGGLSFADARDVAETAVSALTLGRSGERYLLGSANMSFKLFYDRLARIAGRPAPRFVAPAAATKVLDWFPSLGKNGFAIGYDMNRIDLQMSAHTWYLDDSKARQELQWAPRDPLQTLTDTIGDLKLMMAKGA